MRVYSPDIPVGSVDFYIHKLPPAKVNQISSQIMIMYPVIYRHMINSFRLHIGKSVCLLSRYPRRFSRRLHKLPPAIILELTLSQSHLNGENASRFSAAVDIHTVPIFVLPGTHYFSVHIGGVDSKLVT